MDNTNYDLLYLVNPNFAQTIEKKELKENQNKELGFYKKRIFILTKELLKGSKTDNDELNKLFEIYSNFCIDYFKFKDKSEIIQNDYKKYNKKKRTVKSTDISKNDILLMRKKDVHIPKITDIVKSKKSKNEKKNIIPKIRKFNNKKNDINI